MDNVFKGDVLMESEKDLMKDFILHLDSYDIKSLIMELGQRDSLLKFSELLSRQLLITSKSNIMIV